MTTKALLIPCVWNMTAPPFLFPFRLNLLLCQTNLSITIQQTKWKMWKNGFHRVEPHAEQVGQQVGPQGCHAAPTAERRSKHLNNNNCNSNPDCLPIRITFFNNNTHNHNHNHNHNHTHNHNNQNHYWCVHCPCRQPQPIRRLVVSAERHRDCRENKELRAFVQDTWLVEKPAAAINAAIKAPAIKAPAIKAPAIKAPAIKACIESRCRTPAVPPSS